MNDVLLWLWLGDAADGIKVLCGLVATLIGAGGITVFILAMEHPSEGIANARRIVLRTLTPIALTLLLITIATPSKQWFYIAAGGTATMKDLDSEVGKKVQSMVMKKLDEALGEKK